MSIETLRAYTCGYCGAEPGQPCRSVHTGRQSSEHVDRVIQENAAWKRDHPNQLEDAARGRI